MFPQIIVTGTKHGYYSKFKTIHDRLLFFISCTGAQSILDGHVTLY